MRKKAIATPAGQPTKYVKLTAEENAEIEKRLWAQRPKLTKIADFIKRKKFEGDL